MTTTTRSRLAPITVIAAVAAMALSPAAEAAPKAPDTAPSATHLVAPKLHSEQGRRAKAGRTLARSSAFAAGATLTGTCSYYQSAGIGFSGQLNSTYAGGDTYWFSFRTYVNGSYGPWTEWNRWGSFYARQAPSWSPAWITTIFWIPRKTWVAVQVQAWSYKAGGVVTNKFLYMTGETLSEASPDHYYCRTQ